MLTSRRRALLGLGSLALGGGGVSCASHESGGAPSASPSSPASSELRRAGPGQAGGAPADHARALAAARDKIRPLHTVAGEPKPGEWRAQHREAGQTFEQWLASGPTLPTAERSTLVVVPLGSFGAEHKKIVDLVTRYMALYFSLPTRMADAIPLSAVPASARRTHPTWGDAQILSSWVLEELLAPKLPADAAAVLALTTSDLWPGRGWNFVFGQADLRKRVGVWSLYRYGDPAAGRAAFDLALRRSIKIAIHETGHMFSLEHCTAYRCVQAGVNSLEEEDRAPLWLCPECMPKIAYATHADPAQRYDKLAAFCKEHGLAEEAAFFEKSAAALQG